MKDTFSICLLIFSAAATAQELPDKKRIDALSNPKRIEFSPTISADGRTMIYETQNGDKWELYQSRLGEDNVWSQPVPLSSINDKCHFIAGPSLSYDGNVLYYTAFIEGVTKTEDIFSSVRLDNEHWSEPQALGPPVNTTDLYEGFPSIAADGQSLYFIRQNEEYQYDRKTKEACFKIYVSQKTSDGSWAEPEPLPEPVNIGCERDPRIMADNHTLIFSSIREEGKGKFDLYESRLSYDGSWDEPVALGFVNSEENDQSPCISASGSLMYYYSNEDIYSVMIPPAYRQLINITLLGTVTAGPVAKPVKAVIVVKNVKTGDSYFTQSNEHDGQYSIVMSAGEAYEVTFSNSRYHQTRFSFDYSHEQAYREERKDVNLESAWPVNLVIQDKDLKRTVRSMVVFTRDDGAQALADTVETPAPKTITLQTDHAYTLAVSAPDYKTFSRDVTFVPQLFHQDERFTVLLEHETVPVTADVTEGVSGPRRRVSVTFRNDDTGEVIVSDAGEVVNLRKGDRYQVMTSSEKGYAYAMQSFVAGEGHAETIPLPILELKEGTTLSLNHIYFQTNSAELNEGSTTELDQIVRLLKQNPAVVIEISAHTDDIGSDAYNDNLSQRRAQRVAEYLVSKDVPMGQLVSVGYGKRRPIVPNDSDENRAKNRRVELLVLKGQ